MTQRKCIFLGVIVCCGNSHCAFVWKLETMLNLLSGVEFIERISGCSDARKQELEASGNKRHLLKRNWKTLMRKAQIHFSRTHEKTKRLITCVDTG